MAEANNRPAWVKARNFIPGKTNKFGEFQPLPRAERWGNIMFEEEEAAKEAAQQAKVDRLMTWVATSQYPRDVKDEVVKLFLLDKAARQSDFTRNVTSPTEGQFKTGADGKKYRFTSAYWKKITPSDPTYNAGRAASAAESVPNPKPGDYKKVRDKIFRWTQEPTWLQVERKTNYNIDLADTFDRYARLGKPYLDARDELWSIFYPDQPPIYRPAAYRRRNTRRANNRKSRKNTRRNNKY